ncbi:MAG TPA: hypothetical protein VF973_04515 [Myxococcales bacterium]
MKLLDDSASTLGRPLARVSALLAAIGALALVASLVLRSGPAAIAALAASWLFLVGLGAGGLALSAAARVAQGRFLDPVLPRVEALSGFLPAALGILAVLVAAAPAWVPGSRGGAWATLAVRDLLGGAVLFALGSAFLRRSRRDRWARTTARAAIAYLAAYAVVLSLWTVDLIVGLSPGEPSAIVPPQAFMAALLSAIAWAALWGSPSEKLRHDLGRLLFGFCAFWAYLVWCSVLPVWYANIPAETAEVLARWSGGWRALSIGILCSTFVVPFTLLLPERTKRSRAWLGGCATSVLAGLAAERFLLVVPPLHLGSSAIRIVLGALVALGMAGCFAVLYGAALAANRSHADHG